MTKKADKSWSWELEDQLVVAHTNATERVEACLTFRK